MSRISLAQAVRNAIEGEYHAAEFYTMLARDNRDERAVRFLSRMADEELKHAQQIEGMGSLLGAGELPDSPDIVVDGIETIRSAEGRADLTYREALEIALAAEHKARRFYDVVAALYDGEVALLFSTIARAEAQHAAQLDTLLAHLEQTESARVLELPAEWLVDDEQRPSRDPEPS